MKRTTQTSEVLKRKAYNLFKTGMAQKDIAAKIGVTEKTVSTWIKRSPVKLYMQSRNDLQKCLLQAIKENRFEDVARLTDSICKLEKAAKYAIGED